MEKPFQSHFLKAILLDDDRDPPTSPPCRVVSTMSPCLTPRPSLQSTPLHAVLLWEAAGGQLGQCPHQLAAARGGGAPPVCGLHHHQEEDGEGEERGELHGVCWHQASSDCTKHRDVEICRISILLHRRAGRTLELAVIEWLIFRSVELGWIFQ